MAQQYVAWLHLYSAAHVPEEGVYYVKLKHGIFEVESPCTAESEHPVASDHSFWNERVRLLVGAGETLLLQLFRKRKVIKDVHIGSLALPCTAQERAFHRLSGNEATTLELSLELDLTQPAASLQFAAPGAHGIQMPPAVARAPSPAANRPRDSSPQPAAPAQQPNPPAMPPTAATPVVPAPPPAAAPLAPTSAPAKPASSPAGFGYAPQGDDDAPPPPPPSTVDPAVFAPILNRAPSPARAPLGAAAHSGSSSNLLQPFDVPAPRPGSPNLSRPSTTQNAAVPPPAARAPSTPPVTHHAPAHSTPASHADKSVASHRPTSEDIIAEILRKEQAHAAAAAASSTPTPAPRQPSPAPRQPSPLLPGTAPLGGGRSEASVVSPARANPFGFVASVSSTTTAVPSSGNNRAPSPARPAVPPAVVLAPLAGDSPAPTPSPSIPVAAPAAAPAVVLPPLAGDSPAMTASPRIVRAAPAPSVVLPPLAGDSPSSTPPPAIVLPALAGDKPAAVAGTPPMARQASPARANPFLLSSGTGPSSTVASAPSAVSPIGPPPAILLPAIDPAPAPVISAIPIRAPSPVPADAALVIIVPPPVIRPPDPVPSFNGATRPSSLYGAARFNIPSTDDEDQEGVTAGTSTGHSAQMQQSLGTSQGDMPAPLQLPERAGTGRTFAILVDGSAAMKSPASLGSSHSRSKVACDAFATLIPSSMEGGGASLLGSSGAGQPTIATDAVTLRRLWNNLHFFGSDFDLATLFRRVQTAYETRHSGSRKPTLISFLVASSIPADLAAAGNALANYAADGHFIYILVFGFDAELELALQVYRTMAQKSAPDNARVLNFGSQDDASFVADMVGSYLV